MKENNSQAPAMSDNSQLEGEREFINKVYTNYTLSDDPQTKALRGFAFDTISPFLDETKFGLELGCSDGYLTEMLASRLSHLDVVDASAKFIAEASKREIGNVTYVNSLFEEFTPPRKYDFVFATFILEHVLDPDVVLRMVHGALNNQGLLYIVVPNARALSRQLAMHMGLYSGLKALTENDIRFGHRRVYDRVNLNRDTEKAGFETISQGGLMLKILADFQLDKLISLGILGKPQLDGLYKLGLEYPDLCGSIYSICKIHSGLGKR